MRVLILCMAFLWWEKKYPVLRGTEQKPVDPKINRLCFQRRKRSVFAGWLKDAESFSQPVS